MEIVIGAAPRVGPPPKRSPTGGGGFVEAGEKFRTMHADLVAIDCMGFKDEHRQTLKDLCGCPVLLPKTLVARVALEIHESSV